MNLLAHQPNSSVRAIPQQVQRAGLGSEPLSFSLRGLAARSPFHTALSSNGRTPERAGTGGGGIRTAGPTETGNGGSTPSRVSVEAGASVPSWSNLRSLSCVTAPARTTPSQPGLGSDREIPQLAHGDGSERRAPSSRARSGAASAQPRMRTAEVVGFESRGVHQLCRIGRQGQRQLNRRDGSERRAPSSARAAGAKACLTANPASSPSSMATTKAAVITLKAGHQAAQPTGSVCRRPEWERGGWDPLSGANPERVTFRDSSAVEHLPCKQTTGVRVPFSDPYTARAAGANPARTDLGTNHPLAQAPGSEPGRATFTLPPGCPSALPDRGATSPFPEGGPVTFPNTRRNA